MSCDLVTMNRLPVLHLAKLGCKFSGLCGPSRGCDHGFTTLCCVSGLIGLLGQAAMGHAHAYVVLHKQTWWF